MEVFFFRSLPAIYETLNVVSINLIWYLRDFEEFIQPFYVKMRIVQEIIPIKGDGQFHSTILNNVVSQLNSNITNEFKSLGS